MEKLLDPEYGEHEVPAQHSPPTATLLMTHQDPQAMQFPDFGGHCFDGRPGTAGVGTGRCGRGANSGFEGRGLISGCAGAGAGIDGGGSCGAG